jgi:aminoglycoside phosphotransferase (APT) family kinase protein
MIAASPLSIAEMHAVRHAMTCAGASVEGAFAARVLAGGRSNLTLRLTDEAGSSWVLRMPPRAGRTPSAHDVAREFTVIEALARTGIPVPPPVVLSRGDSAIGSDFAVTEFVPGVALRAQEDLEGIAPDQLDAAVVALVGTLASLHGIDHRAVGLADFGRADGYARRQVRRWAGQWDLVAPDSIELRTAAAELADRLSESIPVQPSTSVIHGDFRIDNALVEFGEHPVRIAAIVDWELSTIGDPVADVAMMCAYREPAFDLVLGFPAAWTSPKVPSAERLASLYSASGGVELTNWAFHRALASYKIAVIAAGIDHRHRSAGGEPGADTAVQAVGPFLQAGLDFLLPAGSR